MDVIFARLTLAALSNSVPAVYAVEAIHDGPVATDDNEVFPEHTLSCLIHTGEHKREELFKRYMQSHAYARKLIFSLQHMQNSPQVKTLINRMLEDGIVTTINVVYEVPPVPPKKKKIAVNCAVYRNGIYDPVPFHRDRHHVLDEIMFNRFVTSYLNGEFDQ